VLEQRIGFLRDRTRPTRPLRILDIGANPVHRPDYATLLETGNCEVWGFEPEPAAFAALQAEARPGAQYVNRAVGRPGKAVFHRHPRSGMGSLFAVRKASVDYLGHSSWYQPEAGTDEINLVALDGLEDLPPPDLLKIDIQGGELEVLRSGRQTLSQAVCIIPELRFYRIYEGEPLWGDVDCALREQGFVLHKLLSPVATVVGNSQRARMKNPQMFRNQLIDGDAVYIRDPETCADWTDEQLKHLAVAAAGVFASPDLAVFCLDRLVERGAIAGDVPAGFVDLLPKWSKTAAARTAGAPAVTPD
jgi:FkbM family methyltransferase